MGAIVLMTYGAQATGLVSLPGWSAGGGDATADGTPAAVAVVASPSSTPPAPPTATPSPTPPLTVTPTTSPTTTPSPAPTRTPTASPTVSPTGTATRTPTATVTATATPNVKKLSSAEVTELLRKEIENQRAQFQDARVRFVPPNRVVVAGRTGVRGVALPVEAELTLGVSPAGRPQIVAHKLSAGLLPVPPEGQAALAARVAAANADLARLVPAGQRVRRVWTTAEAAFAEVED